MGDQHLDQLGISAKQVQWVVGFLEAYAEASLQELGSDFDERAPGSLDRNDDREWTIRIDAASALREAGQWALLLDVAHGSALLDRAADLFVRLDHGFGYFLKVVLGYWATELSRSLARTVEHLFPGVASSATPAPLLHAQQQAYLLLAGAGSAPVARAFGDALWTVVETSPHRSGVVPVGPLGTPIRRYWAIAGAILRNGRGAAVVADHIVAIGRRYREAAELAGVNPYLWNHAAAPVDVVDVDIVGLVVLAARQFGNREVRNALENGMAEGGLAAIQFDLGIQLARTQG